MTEQEIVLETIEYYRTHTRGKISGVCVYLTKNGNMCAVGRCMENPTVETSGIVTDLLKRHGDMMFKEQYRGQSAEFWGKLQVLHDSNCYWVKNNNGGQDLTLEGKEYCKNRFGVCIV